MGVKASIFQYIYMYVNMYITATPKEKKMTGQSSVPRTGARGMFLSQVLQDETSHSKDHLSHLQDLGNVTDGQHPKID
jgi:hypothetical protein